jgi:cytochrome oxidase Cu insertion factor (SCO1/SenC/PrrC family)
VGFVLITFDPVGDSPGILRAFRKREQLFNRWTLLRGTEDATQSVASMLGISFEKASYRLAHSNGIVLLDSRGKIIFWLPDLHAPINDLVKAVNSAVPTQVTTSP